MSAQLMRALLDLPGGRAAWLNKGDAVSEVVFASDAGPLLDQANLRHVYGRI